MRVLRPASTLRPPVSRGFGSGGGGKPPRRPIDDPTKGHYIDHPDLSAFNRILREMLLEAQKKGYSPFKCHAMGQQYVLYRHHLNKGGAEAIMNEGGLRSSEAATVAGGADAARATGVADPETEPLPDRDMVFFITEVEPGQTGNGSGFAGIGWRIPFLPFQRALMVYADSKTMKEFKDKT